MDERTREQLRYARWLAEQAKRALDGSGANVRDQVYQLAQAQLALADVLEHAVRQDAGGAAG